MLLKVSCDKHEVEAYEDYYASNGFQLVQREYENDIAILHFRGVSASHSAEFVGSAPGASAFLEFADGSVSPLYVRRTHSFDD